MKKMNLIGFRDKSGDGKCFSIDFQWRDFVSEGKHHVPCSQLSVAYKYSEFVPQASWVLRNPLISIKFRFVLSSARSLNSSMLNERKVNEIWAKTFPASPFRNFLDFLVFRSARRSPFTSESIIPWLHIHSAGDSPFHLDYQLSNKGEYECLSAAKPKTFQSPRTVPAAKNNQRASNGWARCLPNALIIYVWCSLLLFFVIFRAFYV